MVALWMAVIRQLYDQNYYIQATTAPHWLGRGLASKFLTPHCLRRLRGLATGRKKKKMPNGAQEAGGWDTFN